MTGVEWRIAALCTQLADGELSRRLANADAKAALARVLDAIRFGEPSSISPADLDALEDAAAGIGIDGLTTGARSLGSGNIATGLPGLSENGPHFAWVCPLRACARVELDIPDDTPGCAIGERALDRMTQP
jgi:hypothetical protein